MTDRIEKTIQLKAPVTRVWRALTDAVEFGAWFGVKLEQPFVAGEIARGHFTMPRYEHLVWEARIVTIEFPVFAFTWHPYAVDSTADYSQETPTRVEFRVSEAGAGTCLVVEESGFDSLPLHRRPDALRMNESGWETQLRNIAAHVGG